MTVITSDLIKRCLLSLAAADSLGVSFEFMDRSELEDLDVEMLGHFGVHNQPKGAFSDDTSLTMCLAESLAACGELNIYDLADRCCRFYFKSYWTSHGYVFDVGHGTKNSIMRLKEGVRPDLAGEFDEFSNGNGSLMRVLPLLFHIYNKPIEERYRLTKLASSLTHGHIRSIIACFYYLELCRQLLFIQDKFTAYHEANRVVSDFLSASTINPAEIALFSRVLDGSIPTLHVDQISSTGYVIDCLEASIWSFLTRSTFRDACVAAIKLGNDTDTNAVCTAGLCSTYYREADSLPQSWLDCITRKKDIIELAKRLATSLNIM